MIYFLYNGSLEGLFTAIHTALGRGEVPDGILTDTEYQPGLFSTEIRVVSNPALAGGLLERLARELGREVIQELFYCYLAETPGRERLIFDFVRLALVMGKSVVNHYTDPAVLGVHRLSERVAWETLRLKGILRFRRLAEGMFYGPVAPDHNVVQLLAPHFAARFPAQSWVIHDCRRSLAVYYDERQWRLVNVTGPVAPELLATASQVTGESGHLAPDEILYQKLWTEYFQKIAITERTNPRLQRQHLPERYWRYLVEEPRSSRTV